MEAQATHSNTHPMMIIAAIAVTLLSAAGIGAIMGWIPSSNSQQAAAPALVETPKTIEAVKATEVRKVAEAPKPAAPAGVAKPKPVIKAAPLPEQTTATATEPGVIEYAPPTPPPVQMAAAPPAKLVCLDCGIVGSVRTVEKAGEGSGLGAVAGAVAGGVLGHQVGGGRGKDVMTVLGAIGGGFAGNQVEKNVKKTKSYEITVRFEDGNTRVFNQDTEPWYRAGDKVRVSNGVLTPNS